MKKILALAGAAVFKIIFISQAQAFCPVCTVAVGAGVGLAEWLGIDDTIIGVWIGALIVSIAMWTIDWLNKKNIHFFAKKIIVFIVYCLLILAPLYLKGFIGHPLNILWGIDKLILGIISGGLMFLLSGAWYFRIKEKNNGHPQFPFQKIVMALGLLTILSFIFYFLTL